jgi:exopolysaccharide biosynthesis WecB/TagA/CpsF family protein
MLVSILNCLLILTAAILLLPVMVFCIQCLAALFPLRRSTIAQEAQMRHTKIAVLMPAHNEEIGIALAIQSVLPQLHTGDRLLVIADNCTDATAAVARTLGAEVIERHDPQRRGKGFALEFGLTHLAADAPDVVVMIDSDCDAGPGMLDALVSQVIKTWRPAQGIYLLESPKNPSPKDAVSALAFLVKNKVRPRGLARLGLPCLLTGSGMAFPWFAIRGVSVGSDNIVEDMQLSIELTLHGSAPKLCPAATLNGRLPPQGRAAQVQRTRWEHGHLQVAMRNVFRLLGAGIVRMDYKLLSVAADLAVPPLSLLVATLTAASVVSGIIAILTGATRSAAEALAVGLACVVCCVALSWAKFGRSTAPATALLAAPFYILAKLPIYFAFALRRETRWVRTARAGEDEQSCQIPDPIPTVTLPPINFHAVTERQCVEHVMKEMTAKRGGMIATTNTDHLQRCRRNPNFARLTSEAQVVVADGMPLIWMSKLRGTPLPERVAGSDLISSLSAAAAERGRSVYLLGGEPGAAEGAARALCLASPTLRVAGVVCPQPAFENDPHEMQTIESALIQSRPDIVFVALGSPKQEELIRTLRDTLPEAWWIGVGYSFSFLSGHGKRAPLWMRKRGLEWLHRLVLEPRRLFKRYVIDGLPFFMRFFAESLLARFFPAPEDLRATPAAPAISENLPNASGKNQLELLVAKAFVGGILSIPIQSKWDSAPRGHLKRRLSRRTSLDRLKGVILLGGSVRPSAFRKLIGRAIVDLPLEDGRSVLSNWQDQAADLAREASLHNIGLYVTLDANSPGPALPDQKGEVEIKIRRDRSRFRGTGGILRDLAQEFEDEDLLVVANAGQVLTSPLSELVNDLAARGAAASFVSHFDGTPSGLMVVRSEALKMISADGYVDMKEQALPSIAARFDVAHIEHSQPTGLPIRSFKEYMIALQWWHRMQKMEIESIEQEWDDGFAGPAQLQSRFCIVEPGARVEPGAHLYDSVVLRGARVRRDAIVVRSVICPASVLGSDQIVIDQSARTPLRRDTLQST